MTNGRLPVDQIIQGDSIEVLRSLPGESVDMVFADPPYNLQLQQELWRPNMTRVDAVDDEWDQFSDLAAYDSFTQHWLGECRRVLKPNGTLWVIGTYHNIFRIGALLMDLDFWILNNVVWIKHNPMPNFQGTRFTNSHETLIWAQKHKGAQYTFNYQAMKALNDGLQMRSDWYIPICSGKERIRVDGSKAHPTQKPEQLLYRVLLSSTNPGDICLDPFFGSGTLGAVARKLGRRWIGIERDASYVEVARARIAAVEPAAPEALLLAEKKKQRRIPFGVLLERGLLQPGQPLYFTNRDEQAAMVLSSGELRYNGFTGSIHAVARSILNAPCNGWEVWYYADERGERVAIDALRELVRVEDEIHHGGTEDTEV